MATIHISEADATADAAAIWKRARAGDEVLIDSAGETLRVQIDRKIKSVDEKIASIRKKEEADPEAFQMGCEFADDLEDIIRNREALPPSAWGLVVDTSQWIAVERRKERISSFLERAKSATEDGYLAISAVTVFEMERGLYRALNDVQWSRCRRFIDELTSELDVLPFTSEVAGIAARLEREIQVPGQNISLADLMIAATARSGGLGVATINRKDFVIVPGLRVVTISAPS